MLICIDGAVIRISLYGELWKINILILVLYYPFLPSSMDKMDFPVISVSGSFPEPKIFLTDPDPQICTPKLWDLDLGIWEGV